MEVTTSGYRIGHRNGHGAGSSSEHLQDVNLNATCPHPERLDNPRPTYGRDHDDDHMEAEVPVVEALDLCKSFGRGDAATRFCGTSICGYRAANSSPWWGRRVRGSPHC